MNTDTVMWSVGTPSAGVVALMSAYEAGKCMATPGYGQNAPFFVALAVVLGWHV